MTSVTDNQSGYVTTYTDGGIKVTKGGAELFETGYDSEENYTEASNGTVYTLKYGDGGYDQVTGISENESRIEFGGKRIAFNSSSDWFGRDISSSITAANSTGNTGSVGYSLTYKETASAATEYIDTYTSTVKPVSGTKTDTIYRYTYDNNGNIRTITKDGILQYTYNYDEAGQLTRADDAVQNKSFTYTYDIGGNIVSKKEYAYTTGTLGTATNTINYTYDSVWKDKLTSYNGKAITYDEIGNPLSYDGSTNPFRYRGYYYDIETELYYLQSRYYDPEWGRFLNADSTDYLGYSGFVSYNLFAYCENNPVIYYDPTGFDRYATWVLDVAAFHIYNKKNCTCAIDAYFNGTVFYSDSVGTQKHLYDTSINWWAKSGSIKKYGTINKKNYDRYDTYILGFTNYWNSKLNLTGNKKIDPNIVKAMCVVESTMGYDSNQNGNRDIMQVLDPINPALFALKSGSEGTSYGIQKGGYGSIRKLYDSKGKFVSSKVTPMLSVGFGVLWLAYKTKYRGSLYDGVKVYNQWNSAGESYRNKVYACSKDPVNWIKKNR